MKKLTNKEKEIMDLYWQHGPMFVKELLEFYDEHWRKKDFSTTSSLVTPTSITPSSPRRNMAVVP